MTIEEIKQILMDHYRLSELEADNGCYINNKWLSVQAIIDILENNM